MAEYIEREKAKQRLVHDYAYAAANILDEIPAADVVEVVRCKDCKYSKEADGNDEIIICNIDGETDEETGIDYGFVTYYSKNHFCGYGERKCEDDKH